MKEKNGKPTKKIKVHRKCTCLKKISGKMYIMIIKVVKNIILNNFVIHCMVLFWSFLKRSSISKCLSKVVRFLKYDPVFGTHWHLWICRKKHVLGCNFSDFRFYPRFFFLNHTKMEFQIFGADFVTKNWKHKKLAF